jgi:hypothetical protein
VERLIKHTILEPRSSLLIRRSSLALVVLTIPLVQVSAKLITAAGLLSYKLASTYEETHFSEHELIMLDDEEAQEIVGIGDMKYYTSLLCDALHVGFER